MTAALGDDAHVAEQRERYRARRTALLAALAGAGLVVDRSAAGLYLWARPAEGDDDCWATVARLAERGVLVAPGSFYGAPRHVRIALTGTDERIAAAAARLAAVGAR